MTVASETNRSGPYSGNGVTTVFAYGFRIVDQSHLQVIRTDATGDETTLALLTDYTVSGVGSAGGGSIILTTALPSGSTVTILRNIPFTQETDLENQGAYYAQTVEDALDLAVMRDQQLAEKLNRAVLVPATETDPTGALASQLAADITRLADSADNIDTVADSIADVNTVADNVADLNTVADNIGAIVAAAGSVLDLVDASFTGDGSETSFILPAAAVSAQSVLVWVGGVRQVPGDDYSVSGTMLTLTATPGAGVAIDVLVITAVTAQAILDLYGELQKAVNIGRCTVLTTAGQTTYAVSTDGDPLGLTPSNHILIGPAPLGALTYGVDYTVTEAGALVLAFSPREGDLLHLFLTPRTTNEEAQQILNEFQAMVAGDADRAEAAADDVISAISVFSSSLLSGAFSGRNAAVSAATSLTWPVGSVISDGNVKYKRSGTGSAIPDMPGWVPYGDVVTPLHWGAVGDGVNDDASAIQAMASWVNAKPSDQREEFLFPAGYIWRVGSTVSFNFNGGRAGIIEMQSPIRPDPGIGDAFRIFNGRGGEFSLLVDGGGQDADYSQANPVGGDQAFMLRGLRGATLSVQGYNYKGRVLRITEAIAGEFKTSRFNIEFIQTGDISGATNEICGQAFFIDPNGTAFGHIKRAWMNWDKYGPIFQDAIDLSFGAIEGGWRNTFGIEFRGCASVWGKSIAVGDEINSISALVAFKDSATRRCWNCHITTIFALGAINAVTLENVGLDTSGNERPGITIDHLTTHNNSGVGLKTTNCANLDIKHDSYNDGKGLKTSGLLTNSNIFVNYRSTDIEAITIGAGGGNGLILSGSVKNANTSLAASKSAIDVQSVENIVAENMIISSGNVVDLIRLPSGNQLRMFGGSLTTGAGVVKFNGSHPALASAVRGYVNVKRGQSSILSGQGSVVVTHGMDVTPALVLTQVRNSDANGSRVRPSSIGATTFAIQTISGTVSADSLVDWEAKGGNAP